MKRSFDLNGSSMSNGYWGPKPVLTKKKNPDTIDETIESMPNLKNKISGSSRSDGNTYKNRSKEGKKMTIHSSKSDENDYAKSHLVKEKEMQDKKRNLVFTENIFNMQHKLNEIKPFLIDSNGLLKASQSKPPINPKKIQLEVINPSILLDPAKLLNKSLDLPAKLETVVLKDNIFKPNEITANKIDSLTYRVENPVINAKTKATANANDVKHSPNDKKPNQLKKNSDHLNQPQILISSESPGRPAHRFKSAETLEKPDTNIPKTLPNKFFEAKKSGYAKKLKTEPTATEVHDVQDEPQRFPFDILPQKDQAESKKDKKSELEALNAFQNSEVKPASNQISSINKPKVIEVKQAHLNETIVNENPNVSKPESNKTNLNTAMSAKYSANPVENNKQPAKINPSSRSQNNQVDEPASKTIKDESRLAKQNHIENHLQLAKNGKSARYAPKPELNDVPVKTNQPIRTNLIKATQANNLDPSQNKPVINKLDRYVNESQKNSEILISNKNKNSARYINDSQKSSETAVHKFDVPKQSNPNGKSAKYQRSIEFNSIKNQNLDLKTIESTKKTNKINDLNVLMAQNGQTNEQIFQNNTTYAKSKLFQTQSPNFQKDLISNFKDNEAVPADPTQDQSKKIEKLNPSNNNEMDNLSDRIQEVVDVSLPENRNLNYQQVPTSENPVKKNDVSLNMDSILQSSTENENEIIKKDPDTLFKTHTPENNNKESQIKYNKLNDVKESTQISIVNLFGIDLTSRQEPHNREMSIDCLFGIDLTPRQVQHDEHPIQTDLKDRIKKLYNFIAEKKKQTPEEQKRSRIKCIQIISILFCVLCPVTGIMSIYFSSKTKKYFDEKDLEKAKKYLNKSEWMLIATIFCGSVFLVGLIFFLIVNFVIGM